MDESVDWTGLFRELQAAERKVDDLRSRLAAAPIGPTPADSPAAAGESPLGRFGNRVEQLAPTIVRADNLQRQAAERTRELLARLRSEVTVRLGLVGLLVAVLLIAAIVLLLRR